MAVLLVGPGVDDAVAVRFGTSDAEILTRENARVRLRVPTVPAENVVVTLIGENGEERLKEAFQVLETPHRDAAKISVPPCDSRPERPYASLNNIRPRKVHRGELLTLDARRLDGVTHVSFTVERSAVDPAQTGINPDLVGIDFGAAGSARTAPRYLDTLAANLGRSYGVFPSLPGRCEPANPSGYAAIKRISDLEAVVCVPPLAVSGPLGLWHGEKRGGDGCETTSISVQIY